MIALMPHPMYPDDPEQVVYVPFAYNRQTDEWTPVFGPDGYCMSELGAVQQGLISWLVTWTMIQGLVHRVRAFCEHPKFVEFEADGINARMILHSVHELAEAIELGDVNIRYLTRAPKMDDVIRVGDVLYHHDPDSGVLQVTRELDEEEVQRSPDALFLRSVKQALARVPRVTSRRVSQRGLKDAMDLLRREMQPDGDDREPIQYITDLQFVERIAVVLADIMSRTGRLVSEEGVNAAIAIFTFLRERIRAGGSNPPSLDELFGMDINLEPSPGSGETDGVIRHAIDDTGPIDRDELGDPDKLARGTSRYRVANVKPDGQVPDDDGSTVPAPGSDESKGDPGQGPDSDPDDDEPDDPDHS